MINQAAEILNFSFSANEFSRTANVAFQSVNRRLEDQIESLKLVTERIGESDSKFSGETLMPLVFRKFKVFIESRNENFGKKELRTLCYSLNYSEPHTSTIFSKSDELQLALTLIASHWNNSYINGLFNCYLKNWGSPHYTSFNLLHQLLSEKLTQYSGSRRLLQAIKIHAKFYNPSNGDLLLGSQLSLKNIPISEATKYLSLPDNMFTYPYFSKVILAYYDRGKSNLEFILPGIENALLSHSANTQGSNTSKIVVSQIIIQSNNPKFEHLQDHIKDVAFKLIGDPARSGYWISSDKMSDTENRDVQSARNILNEWITRRFITVFFETCINDDRRKKFWLKMADQISSFYVFGPENIKLLLKRDKRISQYVDSRFQTTVGKKQTSAFLMQVKDYKLIEFSDPGYAFYAYLKTNQRAPSIDKNYNSVDDFRDGNMPLAIYRSGHQLYGHSPEGRMIHGDGDMKWEDVFKSWIKNKIGINV